MADLIQLAELLAEIDREIKRVPACAATLQRARSIAMTIPTVEAEPVVRCKNCRNSSRIASDISGRMRHCWSGRGRNNGDGFSRVNGDGYCDEGERMDADAPERAGKEREDG